MENGASTDDSTGCVRVEFGDSGRVEGLRLTTRWREKLDSERLPAALIGAWMAGLAQRPAPPLPSGSDSRTPPRSPAENRRLLIEAAEGMRRERTAREHDYAGSDVRQHVRVTLTLDGLPTQLEFAEEWLQSVSTERLTDAIREALNNAYEAVDAAAREIGGCPGGERSNG